MTQYIVFKPGAQCIVTAESIVRAIQTAMLHRGGASSDWTCHRLVTYPDHLQQRLLRESIVL